MKCSDITVRNWINSSKSKKNPLGDRDIIHYKWVIDSIIYGSLQRFHPGYMIYTSQTTQLSFKEQMDEFQDEYLFDATVESLKTSLTLASQSPKHLMLDSKQIDIINKRYNIVTSQTSFFRGMVAFVDKYERFGDASSELILGLDTLEVYIQMHGGKVSNLLTTEVTHIVHDEGENSSRLSSLKRKADRVNLKLVSGDWIRKCVDERKLLEL